MSIRDSTEIVMKQVQETVDQDLKDISLRLGTITCPCGRKRAVVALYKCLYCDVWFCERCAEEHFGKTKAEWEQNKITRPGAKGLKMSDLYINKLLGENEKLARERDELKVHCETLREAFDESICLLVTALHEPDQITEGEIHQFRTIERSTPKQNLTDVIAKAFKRAMPSQEMKYQFIDEFSILVHRTCAACTSVTQDTCEACEGTGVSVCEYQIPWQTQKRIWRLFNSFYAEQLLAKKED